MHLVQMLDYQKQLQDLQIADGLPSFPELVTRKARILRAWQQRLSSPWPGITWRQNIVSKGSCKRNNCSCLVNERLPYLIIKERVGKHHGQQSWSREKDEKLSPDTETVLIRTILINHFIELSK